MLPPNAIDNRKFADLIFAKKFATLEQLQALWPYCSPQKNIGMLCVDQGILPPVIYQKMLEFLAPTVQNGQQAASQQQSPAATGTMVQRQAMAPSATGPEAPAAPSGERTESGHSEADFSGSSTELPPLRKMDSLKDILRYARMIEASDVHLSVNAPLLVRRFGSLVPISPEPVPPEQTEKLIRAILDHDRQQQFERSGDLEFVHELSGGDRYRVTVMKQRAGWDLTARCIPDSVRPFEETGMPESCRVLTQWAQGLVLVTGPASCGKSSTLTTLVEMVNQTRPDHIITLELPVEYIFTPANAQITQRQIGTDTRDQDAALRAALREDPDSIVIGELRDLATIRLAVSAAETGHLVFATMNTISASRTIYRLIDSFPPEEQGIMRNMISESLRGVISQQLIPRADGNGMVAAFEVLLVTTAVANMIRKDEAYQLGTAMITGKAAGMQLLDESLRSLASRGLITEEEATARSSTRIANS